MAKESSVSDDLVKRYHLLMRIVSYAFTISTAVFCAIVWNLATRSTQGPFGITTQHVVPLAPLLPVIGSVFMVLGTFLHRQLPASKWFLRHSGIQRMQIYLMLVLLRLTFLQMALIPAMFYFILGYGTDWLFAFGLCGIILMLIGIPSKSYLTCISTE